MSEKNKALRLARELEACPTINYKAHAAELRRLHEENAELREANETLDRRQVWWNDRMFALVLSQRNALLEALKTMLTHISMDEDEWNKLTFDQARAAVKMAEQQVGKVVKASSDIKENLT